MVTSATIDKKKAITKVSHTISNPSCGKYSLVVSELSAIDGIYKKRGRGYSNEIGTACTLKGPSRRG